MDKSIKGFWGCKFGVVKSCLSSTKQRFFGPIDTDFVKAVFLKMSACAQNQETTSFVGQDVKQ